MGNGLDLLLLGPLQFLFPIAVFLLQSFQLFFLLGQDVLNSLVQVLDLAVSAFEVRFRFFVTSALGFQVYRDCLEGLLELFVFISGVFMRFLL